jgi:hypothetical protein
MVPTLISLEACRGAGRDFGGRALFDGEFNVDVVAGRVGIGASLIGLGGQASTSPRGTFGTAIDSAMVRPEPLPPSLRRRPWRSPSRRWGSSGRLAKQRISWRQGSRPHNRRQTASRDWRHRRRGRRVPSAWSCSLQKYRPGWRSGRRGHGRPFGIVVDRTGYRADAFAARSIKRATSSGLETYTAWLAATSIVSLPARLAMLRSRSGLMLWSRVATSAQLFF